MVRTKAFKIYKVTLYDSVEGNQGYVYTGSRREASSRGKDFQNDDPEQRTFETETINVVPTKGGIIYALNQHGGHNDNG